MRKSDCCFAVLILLGLVLIGLAVLLYVFLIPTFIQNAISEVSFACFHAAYVSEVRATVCSVASFCVNTGIPSLSPAQNTDEQQIIQTRNEGRFRIDSWEPCMERLLKTVVRSRSW